jgi:hypothetical protein
MNWSANRAAHFPGSNQLRMENGVHWDDDEGWWSRTIGYGDGVYAARCPKCARFVKTDDSAKCKFESGELAEENATCSKHGRVKTPFLGWKE